MDNEVVVRITANDDTGPGATSARANMAKLGDGINTDMAAAGKKAGDSLGAGITQGADGKLRDARGRFVSFGQDVDDAMGAAGSKAGGSLGDGIVRDAQGRLRDAKGKFVSEGDDAGSGFGDAFVKRVGDAGSKGGNKVIAAIGAAVLAGGPLVGGAIAGIGAAGLTALGVELEKGNPAIKAGWATLTTDAKSAATSAAAAIVPPVQGALVQLDSLVTAHKPDLQLMFAGAANDIQPLVSGLEGLTNNALPGLDSALQHSTPIAQGLAQVERDIGSAVNDAAGAVSAGSGQMGSDLSKVGTTVKEAGSGLSSLISISTGLASGALPTLNAALAGTDNVLSGVHGVLGPLEPMLGGVALAGVAGWKLLPPVLNAASSASKAVAGGMVSMAASVESSAPGLSRMALGAASVTENLGPVGLLGVLGVAALAVAALGNEQRKEAQVAQDQASAALQVAHVLEQQNGVIDDQTRAQTASTLQGDSWVRAMTSQGVSLKDITNAALGVPGALKKVQDQVNALGGPGAIHDNILKSLSLGLVSIHDPANNAKDALGTLDGVAQQATQDQKDLADASASSGSAIAGQAGAATSARSAVNAYGTSLQSLSQAYTQANAGAKFVEDSHDQATTTAGEAISSWKSLQQAVTSAAASEGQAAQGVASAGHAVQQASEGVAAAHHAEGQAALAVGQAEDSYRESLYQEGQAQQAVSAARLAAAQQLVSLKLQAESAATSALSASDAVFQATQDAGKLGVTPGNVKQIAGEKENTGNEKQVEAAIALLAAEDQLAQAQNSSATSQSDLNTARQQGIANNPQVLAAEHALTQSQAAVKSAAQGVTDAEYAQQQAVEQVTNAEYGLQQASQAVATARTQERSAELALSSARDAASRSIDQNTLAGAKNRQSIEGIFEAYVNATGSEKAATILTENIGGAMGFTKGKIDTVIKSLKGLDGTNAVFGITGTPTLNVQQLSQEAAAIGLPTSLEGGHVRITSRASGGPSGGLAWVGEQGAELVSLPPGSTVYPHANSMQMLAAGDAPIPGFAAGGSVGSLASPMSALSTNVALASQWGVLDTMAQGLHVLGGPAPKLPPAGAVDLGGFSGFGGGSHVSGNRAANKQIMQQVFTGYGWGGGAQWAAQDYLETREAGYNNFAQNPHTSAFGMGQFLDGTWAGVGMSKTADPRLQSIGMARYEGQRYGSPIAAANHERAVNWYGFGGPTSRRVVGVGERGPELARIPGRSGGGGASSVHVTVSLEATGGANNLMIGAVKEAIRTGAIRLRTVDGTQVVAG